MENAQVEIKGIEEKNANLIINSNTQRCVKRTIGAKQMSMNDMLSKEQIDRNFV